jgi:hypothetical protein
MLLFLKINHCMQIYKYYEDIKKALNKNFNGGYSLVRCFNTAPRADEGRKFQIS